MHEQYPEGVSTSEALPDASYEIEELTAEEAQAFFDESARLYLGISGDEFRERWHRGDYDDDPDRPEVMTVAMLLPLVEHEPVNR